MNIQVLMSAMYQTDFQLLKKTNICSNALMISQGDYSQDECNITTEEITKEGYKWERFASNSRGVSNSRNLALKYATGDICIFCDSNIVYKDNYIETIEKAFREAPEADIIAFNLESKALENEDDKEIKYHDIHRMPFYQTCTAAHVAFRRERVLSKVVGFSPLFGVGSGKYQTSEDSLFQVQAKRAGLKMYSNPETIASADVTQLEQRTEYDKKYFYDIGAYLYYAFPKSYEIIKFYYPYRYKKISNLSGKIIIENINMGLTGVKKNMSYEEYLAALSNLSGEKA